MSAGKLNFDNEQVGHIEQGATWRFKFYWKTDAGVTIDPSLYTARMQVRKNYGGDLIVELNEQNGRISYDSNGEYMLFLSPAETRLLPPGNYLYDMILTKISDPDDTVRLIEGRFNISPSVIQI